MLRTRVILALAVGLTVASHAACAQTPPERPGQEKPAARVAASDRAVKDANTWFDDDFSRSNGCGRRASDRGFGWSSVSTGDPDTVSVVRDPASPSGCALAIIYQGNPDLADDAWAEQRFTLGKVDGASLREVFVGFVLSTPRNYVHRDAKGPDNNKLLRLWDQNYSGSVFHVGMSAIRKPAGGSQLTAEFKQDGHTGNYKSGPWNPIFTPGKADTIGFYVRTSSGVNVPDGIIRIWWNRELKLDRSNLRLANVSKGPGFNGIGNGYLLGWANSGFTERTEFHVWRFLMAPAPLPWFLPPSR